MLNSLTRRRLLATSAAVVALAAMEVVLGVDNIIAELRTLKIAFVDADWELTQQAAAFKAKGRIAYADCFAAAVAKKFKADLVTGDPELKQVEGEVKVLWV